MEIFLVIIKMFLLVSWALLMYQIGLKSLNKDCFKKKKNLSLFALIVIFYIYAFLTMENSDTGISPELNFPLFIKIVIATIIPLFYGLYKQMKTKNMNKKNVGND